LTRQYCPGDHHRDDLADLRYYYLRVVVYMFMRSGEPRVRRDGWLTWWRLRAVAVVC
jgi:hypothetical protein